jgi:branched-chain amino acid transport system ATP-binding protein
MKTLQRSPGGAHGETGLKLAIGRALMNRPKFLMMDEPSPGIAPLLEKTIFEKIVEINRTQGITILLVEQNANLALEISHYGYVLETGKIILADELATLRQNPQVKRVLTWEGNLITDTRLVPSNDRTITPRSQS